MGRKRVNLDSKFQPKKCAKRYHGDDDRISQLPDDIIVLILSFLSLKEAARTSLLSPRWINLWKHTSCLNFDADSALDKIAIAKQYEIRNGERRKYVNWVNSVLQSHKAVTLKKFRICFDLSRSAKKEITRWLEFAFTRHVQRLELDLTEKAENSGSPCGNYIFPEEEFLIRSIGRDSTPFDFKSLKALSLKCVIVTGEAIEFFLCNCPLLEQLVVHHTNKISNLQICGPSLALKHLEIVYCYDLISIKVSAPNLTSLTLSFPKVEGILLENIPMLVEVSVTCIHSLHSLRPALSCCILQLEILSLQLQSCPEESIELSKFPELPKLKKLAIEYTTTGDRSLMGLTPLIRASPHLQEFVLELIWYKFSRSDREVKNTIKFPHHHLNVVKFCGYYGRASDIELVRYILENSVVLGKMIIDPRYPIFPRAPLHPNTLREERIARDCAVRQLQGEVPQHIELVIV